MSDRIRRLVEKLWEYHQMHHQVTPADAIVVLCSHDTRVAERGAQLFLDNLAPLLIFSGGLGAITKQMWEVPEARLFAEIARGMGVPEDRMLVEDKSTNTGENVLFTKALLSATGLSPRKLILVQKPYMERRAYATFRKVWPEPEVVVTSPQATLDEYLARYSNAALSPHDVISIMVGDLQRIRVYPEKGFQIPQHIPADVWDAFEELVEAGYGGRLVT